MHFSVMSGDLALRRAAAYATACVGESPMGNCWCESLWGGVDGGIGSTKVLHEHEKPALVMVKMSDPTYMY